MLSICTLYRSDGELHVPSQMSIIGRIITPLHHVYNDQMPYQMSIFSTAISDGYSCRTKSLMESNTVILVNIRQRIKLLQMSIVDRE